MEFKELDTIARKAVRKLNGALPLGVSAEDALQDAYVEVLRWDKVTEPPGVAREAFLVMKTWGSLKDKYARDFKKHSERREAETAVWSSAALGPARREDAPDRDGLVPVNPRHQVAPNPASPTDTHIDVHAAIDKLGEPHATMIRMELEGADHATIGVALGFSRSWVSRSIAAAKQQLATLLESYADE